MLHAVKVDALAPVSLTGDQVRFIRNVLGESQSQFAKRIAVSSASIFRLEEKKETSKRGPEIILIAQIAQANGIQVPETSAECKDEEVILRAKLELVKRQQTTVAADGAGDAEGDS